MVKLRLKISAYLFLLALVVPASQAWAYSVQYADKAQAMRLRWKNTPVKIQLSESLRKELPLVRAVNPGGIEAAVERSLQRWREAAGVDFEVTRTDKTDVSPVGLRGDGVNLITIADSPDNILFFDGEPETAAKTRIFFNGKGSITEGDIVLNPYQLFSDDETLGTFDLEAALTHEIGHLLGLGHSDITGATMQGHHAKNGIYNLSVSAFRSLSEDDIAGARALYGPASETENCCGAIDGKLLFGTPIKELLKDKTPRNLQVWLEEAKTGRIIAGTVADQAGAWKLEGLSAGKYNVFTQSLPDKSDAKIKKLYSAERLGEVNIESGKTAQFEKSVTLKPRKLTLDFIGFNSQLSSLAVPVNNGKNYSLFIADKTLPQTDLRVSVSSPFLSIVPGGVRKTEFNNDLKAYLVDVRIADDAPAGEYSLRLRNAQGEVVYYVGALVVDPSVTNNMVSYFLEMNK